MLRHYFDKEKYALHSKNLQLYLRLVLKIKVYYLLKFDQSNWLRPYIEFNTRKRIEAEKNGEKDRKALFISINNDTYDKTKENMRNT